MDLVDWMDRVPLVGVFVLTMFVVLSSIWFGFRIGTWRSTRADEKAAGAIGSVVATMLGLLAFILAFTFGAAASRFDARKQLFLDEVNAIGTAVLRAKLLPEPQSKRCTELLGEYVSLRANPDVISRDLPRLVETSDAILDELWVHTTELAHVDMDPPIRALFVQSINDVIDLQTSRITVGLYNRLPSPVWLCLAAATLSSMFAVGYQFGLSKQRTVLIHVLLALIFSWVLLLIADLDRPSEGSVKLNYQPMIDLKEKLDLSIQAELPQ